MRTLSRKRGSPRGHSLIEAILAVLLLAVIFLGVTPTYIHSELNVERGKNTEIATQAARAEIDMWRERGYAALPAIPSLVASVTQSFNPPAALPNGRGQVTFTRLNGNLAVVATEPAGNEAGRRRISVTVSWDAGPSDRGSVTLTSLMIN